MLKTLLLLVGVFLRDIFQITYDSFNDLVFFTVIVKKISLSKILKFLIFET